MQLLLDGGPEVSYWESFRQNSRSQKVEVHKVESVGTRYQRTGEGQLSKTINVVNRTAVDAATKYGRSKVIRSFVCDTPVA
jgi:hypothetical protein